MIGAYTEFASTETQRQRAERVDPRVVEGAVKNPGWFPTLEVTPAEGFRATSTGGALHVVIGLDVPELVSEPSVRIRVCRANGVAVGIGATLTTFDDLECDAGDEGFQGVATLSGTVKDLPLVNGRYRFDVELLSGATVVAARRVPVDVKGPEHPDAQSLTLPGNWSLRRTGDVASAVSTST